MFRIFKEFTFDAAHALDHLPKGHKCRAVHGHTYRVKVFLESKVLAPEGWIVDFSVVNKVVREELEYLDHRNLNEALPGMRTTCENIAQNLFNRLKYNLPALCKIEVWETPTSGCEYTEN